MLEITYTYREDVEDPEKTEVIEIKGADMPAHHYGSAIVDALQDNAQAILLF